MQRRLLSFLIISALSLFVWTHIFAQSAWSGSAWGNNAAADNCSGGIKLNTDIPFVGNCIAKSTDASVAGQNTTIANAFPKLLGGLMRIVMTVVVIVGFMGILVGGFMMSAWGLEASLMSKWKKLIITVIIGLVVLGLSGIILNLINPNFFGTDSQPTNSPSK